MQRLECGICRTPFKKEYFENDPIINELFNYRNNINININNRQINNNRYLNENNNINIVNQNNNINNNSNTNRNSLRNSQSHLIHNTEVIFGLFILNFQPSKSYCIVSLLLNIFFCGLGTILIGLNKKSVFYTLFGLIQCFCFFFFIYKNFFVDNSNKRLLGIPWTNFFYIYFIILSITFYLSSIYISIFRNFLFFNIRNFDEKKERGFIIFFLNIFIEGLGTILAGIVNLTNENKIWDKIKYIIFGIIQLFGFWLILLGISILNKKNIIDVGIFFLVGFLCYCFSIYTSYLYYKKVTA